MYKKSMFLSSCWAKYDIRKCFLIMKLTILLALAFTFHAFGDTYAQKLTFEKKNATLKEIIGIIQEQTGYNFIINSDVFRDAKNISVSVKNLGVSETLDKCLLNLPYKYVINNKSIIISRKTDIGLLRQQKKITGNVADEKGEPIADVMVSLKNSSVFTRTDGKGNYSLNAPVGNAVLVFSFLGYTTQEVNASDKSHINVVLKANVQKLNETVVIGYGSVNKRDITGAVSQVKMNELVKAPVMSFDMALAGRLAGVQVSSNDGQPGSEGINIVIRGAGSLTQSTSPLYVIDDFPIESFDASSLNMNDIESITVLKDASATAIYGARGANGVVVIETKKGKIGLPQIQYNGSFGLQNITKRVEMMNPYEFVRYELERTNYSETIQNLYTPADLPKTSPFYKANGHTLDDYRNIPGINWQDQVFRNGYTGIHEISMRGGNTNTRYSLSSSIYSQQGVVINSNSNRVTARLALDQTINKKLKTGIVTNYSNNPSTGKLISGLSTHGFDYLMYSVWGYRPVSGKEDIGMIDDQLLDADFDSESEPSSYLINPVVSVKNEDRRNRKINLTANAYVDYNINPYLTLRTTGAFMAYEVETSGFYNSLTSRGTPRNPNNRGSQGDMAITKINMWKSSTFLTYKRKFNNMHNLNVMLGTDFYESASRNYGYSTQFVPEESLGLSGMDDGLPSSTKLTFSKNRINSFFGRANYDFKSKYLLTATFRADGSSKFPVDNRWGYFPSGAFAWRINKEEFMKKLKFVSDAKLRVSYGLTGNNRVSDFAYLPTIIATNIAEAYSFQNGEPQYGYYPGSPGNDLLKWETTKQLDFGLDLSLFNNRIEFVADIYRKKTVDLLLNANMPSHTGFKKNYMNVGELQNDGLELTLNTQNIKTKKFSWSTGFNISFNKNIINSLTNDESSLYSLVTWDAIHNQSFLYAAQVGQQAAMFLGYIFDGVYQVDDFTWQNNSDPTIPHNQRDYNLKKNIPDYGSGSPSDVKPGDIKYKDINNDGTINEYDETIIGNPMPIHMGGITNTFTYKGIELSTFFQWSYGNDLFNANRIYFEGGRPVTGRNQYASYADRWTPENPSNTNFRAGGQGPLGRYSSKNVEDGSYLRLKTISLSYSIPDKYLKSIKIKQLILNATAQNLITWTNYSGMDPEVSVRNSVLTPGFDWSAYPRAKTIVFGIKATL